MLLCLILCFLIFKSTACSFFVDEFIKKISSCTESTAADAATEQRANPSSFMLFSRFLLPSSSSSVPVKIPNTRQCWLRILQAAAVCAGCRSLVSVQKHQYQKLSSMNIHEIS